MNRKITPMMRQYREIKSGCPDAVLLYRMGDFYEMFFEDAEIAAPILQITLTSRDGEIPMCGIPHHALDTYLIRLIRAGKRVAICEQTEDPAKAKGLVKREVVRILTPGCIPESVGVDEGDHHFLAGYDGEILGLFDVTTGTIDLYPVSHASLPEYLSLYPVKELLLPLQIREKVATHDTIAVTPVEDSYFDKSSAAGRLKKALGTSSLKGFGIHDRPAETGVAGALVRYVQETQKSEDTLLSDLTLHTESKVVDMTTIRNLEIFQSSLGESRQSLHHILNRCETAMGSRLLKSWLRTPLSDLKKIHERLLAVDTLFHKPDLRKSLREALHGIGDLERLAARISYRREHPRDLVALARSLERARKVKELLSSTEGGVLETLKEELKIPVDIIDTVTSTLVDSPPHHLKEGGLIREEIDRELDDARSIQKDSRSAILELELKEREKTGINTLKIGYNRVFGYYIEVTKSRSEKVPPEYIRKQTLMNAERYITPEIKELEERILTASETVTRREGELYEELREKVRGSVTDYLKIARKLAVLDCLLSFATISHEYDYVKPELNSGTTLNIREGRHPVVERLLKEEPFTPNDCSTYDEEYILLITGPNMGGKSTYLRQVALIVLLAHIGCFVPAAEASIPLVDRIFTRVGAFDQLAQGESTFMVEMLELAQILRQATDRSLIILDEVGRGTATFDGLSIAWAVVEHIHKAIGAKTLFATHYHELTELSIILQGVKNLSMDVREYEGTIYFLHRVIEGVADRSYGIEVAHLAGVPPAVVERAKEVLLNLEKSEIDPHGIPRAAQGSTDTGLKQLTLFPTPGDIALERIKNLDLDSLTPIEALATLAKLQKRIKKS